MSSCPDMIVLNLCKIILSVLSESSMANFYPYDFHA